MAKLSLENKGEIKAFLYKQKLRGFSIARPTLRNDKGRASG